MSASWIVSVEGRSYGPYTDAQMRAFVEEGRIAPQSLVSREGGAELRPAVDEPTLAPLFIYPVLEGSATDPVDGAAPFGRQDDYARSGDTSHVIIIADMKSRSLEGLEEEIYKLGPAVAFLPQVWLLSTDQSVNAIRNVLVQQLGKLDAIFVIDATHDKAAWFNFGPETDARIRRNWTRTTDANLKFSAAG
jgi:hypothetical protein